VFRYIAIVLLPIALTGDILVSRGSGFHCTMTSTAGQGSGSKSEDMLATIMKQLATMNARLQSMETGELGAQQDTLSSVVERIDLAQTQFAATVGKAVADSWQPTPQTATNRVAAVGRCVTRMMGVKTSSPPRINSSSPSMMGPAIHYRGSTGASGTSWSTAHQN
jgi:hypothetical protein